jgi:hypothetical protein
MHANLLYLIHNPPQSNLPFKKPSNDRIRLGEQETKTIHNLYQIEGERNTVQGQKGMLYGTGLL